MASPLSQKAWTDGRKNLGQVAIRALPVAKSDTTAYPRTRAVSFGTAGALAVLTAYGEEVIIPSGALAAGVMHPIAVKKVLSTGTDAADIVLYW